MANHICGIYAITSPSGRMYIGSSKNCVRRMHSHFRELEKGSHHADALQRAYNKYGGEAMKFSILEECKREDLIATEQRWIDAHPKGVSDLYNSSGIAGRPEHTEEVINKIRKKALGRIPNAEARAKMSIAQTGRKHSEETKQKMRNSHVGVPKNEEHRAKLAKACRGYSKKNTSGCVGVRWSVPDRKWRATMRANGKNLSLGSYVEFMDAARARIAGEIAHWGYAVTTLPDGPKLR